MSGSDFIAVVISGGYALVAYGLWRVRAAYATVNSLGWLMFPIFSIWIAFYLLIPLVDQGAEPWHLFFVWGSRTAHFFTIALIFLVVKIGENTLTTLRTLDTD